MQPPSPNSDEKGPDDDIDQGLSLVIGILGIVIVIMLILTIVTSEAKVPINI